MSINVTIKSNSISAIQKGSAVTKVSSDKLIGYRKSIYAVYGSVFKHIFTEVNELADR